MVGHHNQHLKCQKQYSLKKMGAYGLSETKLIIWWMEQRVEKKVVCDYLVD